MRVFAVIKDINSQSWRFRPSYKVGDKLYLQDERCGSLFDAEGNFVCSVGSQLQIEHLKEVDSE